MQFRRQGACINRRSATLWQPAARSARRSACARFMHNLDERPHVVDRRLLQHAVA